MTLQKMPILFDSGNSCVQKQIGCYLLKLLPATDFTTYTHLNIGLIKKSEFSRETDLFSTCL